MKKSFKGNSNKSGVYQIRNLRNGKVYIGSAKSLKVRALQHQRSLINNKHYNKHLQSAWNLDGSDNFLFEVLEVVEGDKLQRTTKEKEYLEKYYENWEMCYNFQKNPICKQGLWSSTPEETRKKLSEIHKKLRTRPPSQKGTKHSKEHIEKFIEARRGYKHSLETKQKIGASNKGKKRSRETLIKMSEIQKGKKISLETRQKMKETHKRIGTGRGKKSNFAKFIPFILIEKSTGKKYYFNYQFEAVQKLGLHRSNLSYLISGKAKSYKGYECQLLSV